ncbi:MAG: AraC family transcriptional regulator [Victivallaceae bacterium]
MKKFSFFESRGNFEYEQIPLSHALHFIISGLGEFVCDGKSYQAGPGDIFMFFPGMQIYYHDFPAASWQYYWVHFDGNNLELLLNQAGLSPKKPFLKSDKPELFALFSSLEKSFFSKQYSPFLPVAAAWQTLSMLSRKPQGKRNLAEQIKDQIDQAQFGYPAVEELAEAFKVNRTTLYRTFKQAYGCSVKEYLDSVRLKHALSLYKSGVKIDTIGHVCGYGSKNISAVFSQVIQSRKQEAGGFQPPSQHGYLYHILYIYNLLTCLKSASIINHIESFNSCRSHDYHVRKN